MSAAFRAPARSPLDFLDRWQRYAETHDRAAHEIAVEAHDASSAGLEVAPEVVRLRLELEKCRRSAQILRAVALHLENLMDVTEQHCTNLGRRIQNRVQGVGVRDHHRVEPGRTHR